MMEDVLVKLNVVLPWL